ncbi:uncharacterized protein LOC135702003 isoform X1 [Ochlerotatus camptorhynchus]|uniref:uncharacterized protein LOC135702003 isoform X1 n=1 Tax=Ochlerotatus camptorhynchus TaxID=644619 RepID=UPI0031DA04E9
MRMTSPTKIMLIACGSFSPPTPMHFRMFEIARDHFEQMGTAHVVGGVISPVHDSYGKNGLVTATHRCTMIKIGLQSSDWIRLSEWETQQEEWTRTRLTLQYHQNFVNSYLKDSNNRNDQHIPSWIPEGLKKTAGHVQMKLLCGADLLESFATPGLWKDEDIEAIVGQHGIVVVSRAGANAEQFIFNSDLLSRYRRNITIVTNWITNDVSSTLVRRLLNRGLSVKYLLDDYLIEYIKKNGLYGTNDTKYILPVSTSGEMMSISPVSPINDNDDYVESRNELNTFSTLESMDDTDFPQNTLNRVFCCGTENNAKTATRNARGFLTHPGSAVQIITTTTTSAATSNASSVVSDSGVGSIAHHTADGKVCDNKSTIPTSTKKYETCTKGNTTAQDAQSDLNLHNSTGKSTLEDSKKPKDLKLCVTELEIPRIQSNASITTAASNETNIHVESSKDRNRGTSAGRISPAKSYDDMIKFVFTEHGIRVISDREYVV